MQKPNNYETTQEQGSYTPVSVGGHKAVIKKVEETTSKNGKPMIKVAIDFDKNDKQPEYFMNSFRNDIRPDKKWPYQATQYILAEDQDGNCSKALKTFVSCAERSNDSKTTWGDGFAKWFTNKKIGVVFGDVEEEYNGNTNMRQRIRWFCDYDKAESVAIPEARYLNNASAPATKPVDNSFMDIPDTDNEEIPF